MSLETFTGYIPALVQSNPTAVDPKSEGDDHLRGIKKTLSVTFSGFVDNESVEVTAGQINNVVSQGGFLPGMVQAFAFQTPPAGWLKCNAQAVSRTEYAALFAAIGTAYGAGDGSTTFNLPETRGLFVRGWVDVDGYVDYGRVFGTNQASNNLEHTHATTVSGGTPHTHAVTGGAHTHTVTAAVVSGSGINGGGNFSSHSNQSITTSSSAHTHTVSNESAHTHTVTNAISGINESRPTNVVMSYFIKT